MKPKNDRHRQCKALRMLHDLTMQEVADLVGVGFGTVYRYERGEIKELGPASSKLDEFYKTLYALEVSANELV